MILRSSAFFFATLLGSSFVGPTHARPTPAEVHVEATDEVEDWQLEVDPELDFVPPSEEELERLVREGGTVRVQIGGEVHETFIDPPSGSPLTAAELEVLEASAAHQETLVALLERATREAGGAAALVAFVRDHRPALSATLTARQRLETRLLDDEAALLSVPAELLGRLVSAFARSVILIEQAGPWLDRPEVLDALRAFTFPSASGDTP